MTTVFVVNHQKKDNLDPALIWGDLKYINIDYIFSDEITDDQSIPADFIAGMKTALAQFNPDKDYLLIACDHLQIVAFAAMLGKKYGKFRVLRWDRVMGGYAPVTITA